ncbi:transmembrane protein 47-like [Saccoglossus kowalevskii]|uniref:Lens fiber membrane intrinsic protein-like n=1 Tax=Saccoglossus kowalevskii TaxID=10224 RepID=A0ABM0GWQ6_SACKO|nr:PREDICTED: lens fiber membrane intrinsic protein-like [Saccoglossus kowalevskii]
MATTTTVTTTVVKPLRLIGFISSIIAFPLLLAACIGDYWMEARGFYMGLWDECYNGTRVLEPTPPPYGYDPEIHCYDAVEEAWLLAVRALVIICILCDVAAIVIAIVGYFLKMNLLYRVAAIVLFFGGLCLLISVIVFPSMFMQSDVVLYRGDWELGWCYGVAWGALFFIVAAGILLLCDDNKEIYHDERVYYTDA